MGAFQKRQNAASVLDMPSHSKQLANNIEILWRGSIAELSKKVKALQFENTGMTTV